MPIRGKTSKNTQWSKLCPICNEEMFYSSKGNLSKAILNNRNCMKCKNDFTPEYLQKLSAANTGRVYGPRKANTKTMSSEFIRSCPSCSEDVLYSTKYALNRATKNNMVCNSCSTKIYKKSFKDVIKPEHIQKMAARKAGYATYEEYVQNAPAKKMYYIKVRKITEQQPFHLLENFDKLSDRGLCGKENGYQIDHIISVDEGFANNIDPYVIGNIKNLRIVSWQENRKKSNKASNSFYVWMKQTIPDIQFNYKLPNTSHVISLYSETEQLAIQYTDIVFDGEYNGGVSKLEMLKKRNMCIDAGLKFIQLFSSEWNDKMELVKSKILYILKKGVERKIHARKLSISEITMDTAKEFLQTSHIQGFISSEVYLGGYFQNELVTVMTFSHQRVITGNKAEAGTYEMVRYAIRAGSSISGGFSKMLKYFIQQYTPKKIYSYANKRFSSETCVYSATGFVKVSESQPSYYYSKNNKLIHRYKFRKANLVKAGHDSTKSETEITKELGYDRIWDCGHYKYELNLI